MLSESRMRIRHHQKDPYEYVFGASIYCLKHGDDEAARLLSAHLNCVDGGNDCELCGRRHKEYLSFCKRVEEAEAMEVA